jgi:cytochrome c-type biogenesis protein CcmE
MTPQGRARLSFILMIVASLGAAVSIALYALRDNVAFFYSPSDILRVQNETPEQVMPGRVFRLGGLVKENSLVKEDASLSIHFIVTDLQAERTVHYTGILPDLFREGQGVVAKGTLDNTGVFQATEMLAKHDEKYMPPEVAKALKRAETKTP